MSCWSRTIKTANMHASPVWLFLFFFLHSRVSESVAGPTLMKYSTRPLLRGCCFKRRTTLHGATSEVDAALLLCLVNNWRRHHITSAGQSGPTCWTLSGFIAAFRMKGLLWFQEEDEGGGSGPCTVQSKMSWSLSQREQNQCLHTEKNRNSFSVEGWKGGNFFAGKLVQWQRLHNNAAAFSQREHMRIAFRSHAVRLKQRFIVKSRRLTIISETMMAGSDIMCCANSTCKSACQDGPRSWPGSKFPSLITVLAPFLSNSLNIYIVLAWFTHQHAERALRFYAAGQDLVHFEWDSREICLGTW